MATDPKLTVRFFRTQLGNEPVREWLKSLSAAERKAIGEEIRTVQFGWPLGMPLVRKLDVDLWEVRVRLKDRVARIFLTIEASEAILLHGFIKKSQKIPDEELATAVRRKKQLMSAAKQPTVAASRN
jgi:phage-related protein